MNLAQPALSQQIPRLEQVGSPLYTRNSRIVELTDAGRAMLEPARAELQAADQAEWAARDAARATAHTLRVGVSFYLEDIVPAVAAYAASTQTCSFGSLACTSHRRSVVRARRTAP